MTEDLHAQARALYERLRTDVRDQWNRDLPFDDLLFDRWERASSLGFGDGASIYHSAYVFGDVKVGANTWIGPFTMLDGSGGLEIGEWCSISSGVQLYSHDTVDWAVTGGAAPPARSRTVVEDSVYIGAGTIVARGVTIGAHSIVGAASFVNQDVPSYSIVGGIPARRLGWLEIVDGEVKRHYAERPKPSET